MILFFLADVLRIAALLRAMNLTPAEDIYHDIIPTSTLDTTARGISRSSTMRQWGGNSRLCQTVRKDPLRATSEGESPLAQQRGRGGPERGTYSTSDGFGVGLLQHMHNTACFPSTP